MSTFFSSGTGNQGSKVRVLVVTGSSGGHIFPAINFLDTLKDNYGSAQALFVLPKRAQEKSFLFAGHSVRYLSITQIAPGLNLKFVSALLNFLKGSLESLRVFIQFRPDIVVGFGTLDTIPLIMLAWFFRAKTLIHEQNVLPGKANRLLAKFSDKVAISFAQSGKYFGINKERLALTGNPVRRGLQRVVKKQALDFFGFEENKFTLLVMGGSAGSRSINGCFIKAYPALAQLIQVIHLSGGGDYERLLESYGSLNCKAKLFGFLKEMQYAYSASSLAVCRGGATTISELIYFQLPAIIIPYPFAYKHQSANAGILREAGCAVVIEEPELDTLTLGKTISELAGNQKRLEQMKAGYNNILSAPAEGLLVNEAMRLACSYAR